ncbi:VOC family protein [Novosphingobium album (ex Liu et al. 2023)]|uniref:VOC family protein n=1 Tax=Novosphingobium album (ex Liu et al. 2023) TaxID=3031130 RepID=A0ABT5WTT3_9SPHN|nr:VOC family protein [Novosphingobium album (ex Liu et al. 2023)]MDE8653297.1 VOC family protein [Novosphingobium album (ex Liu et al. 2023)]
MIGYALVGSNDLPKALEFYDQLFAAIGASKVFDHPSGGRVYGAGPDKPMFGVVAPANGEAATFGNGTMISFLLDSIEQIETMYAKAIALGGSDEGGPGWRGEPGGFYGAYFRDLDGNKLCAYRVGPA